MYKEITIRCYAGLNDFLSEDLKHKQFGFAIKMPVTIGEALQKLGIPLSEIELVLRNSNPVKLNSRLKENDRLSLYPVFESINIGNVRSLDRKPIKEFRFILDAHLGKLAKYLRMLGFDTLYRNDFGDRQIIDIAVNESRIILSRDKALLSSKKVEHGYYVRAVEKYDQLVEIVNKFNLYSEFKSFSRCMTCNSTLENIPKGNVQSRVDSQTFELFDDFFYCRKCDKIFWKGSHFERMERLIHEIINSQ